MNREMLESQVEDLRLIEQDLLRPLSAEEAQYVIDYGFKKFFNDKLNWDDEFYTTYRHAQQALAAYCSFTGDEFDKLKSSQDNKVAKLLRAVANRLQYGNEKTTTDVCKKECDSCERFAKIAKIIDEVIEEMPREMRPWLLAYDEADRNHVDLVNIVMDYEDMEQGRTWFVELMSAIEQRIKDVVTKYYCDYLLNHKGTEIDLPEVILDSVFSEICKQDNVRVKVINKTIVVL